MISSVALLESPPESVTLTTNELVPASTSVGVPETAPLLATLNQAGPPIFEKVSVSPGFGSVPWAAIEAEYGWPAFAAGSLNGLLPKDGDPLTLISIVA